MRPFIIVSVQDEVGKFSYDVEIPTDIPVIQVTANIAEVLNYYHKKEVMPMTGCRLWNKRTGKIISPDSTFAKEGIWQGDIIQIKR